MSTPSKHPQAAEINRIAGLLIEAWAKAEPNHGVTLHPTSYVATFADMARAVVEDALERTRRTDTQSWIAGFAVALAEMHRLLLNGNNSSGVCEVARAAGLTIAGARAAGVSSFDIKELRKAGLK